MNMMKNNYDKVRRIATICFTIVSLGLFVFLFCINQYNSTNHIINMFNSKDELDIVYGCTAIIHVVFTILVPIFLSRLMFRYLYDYLSYISFLSINLILNCLTYYLVLIEGNERFTVFAFDVVLLVSFIYYLIFNKQIKYGMDKRQKEREQQVLTMFKTASNIMLGQMKPHFLYNTLNTIKFLITEDAEKAEFAVVKFSEYLRQNMNALSSENFILFEQELHHIKNYVDIEKLRFDERLRVHYNIKDSNFFVPSLSIQPLVENAIKHGITKKIEGGDVWVNVYSENKFFVIEIIDNGLGFDMAILDNVSSSVALKNIKDRIGIIEDASFNIESKVGEGTKCTIRIPEKLPQNLNSLISKEGE